MIGRKKMHKKTRKIFKILLIIVFIWIVLAIVPRFKSYKGVNPLIVEEGKIPLLIAHGGGNREFPDNTLEAFYNAYNVDPNVMMETDVSITKDGVIILSHDITLDRKTSLTNAYIKDVLYSDLVNDEVDFGYENNIVGDINISGDLIKYKDYLGNNVTPLDVTYPEGINFRHESKFLVTTLEELIVSFPNNYINVEIKQSGETGLKALKEVIRLMDLLDNDYNTYERIVLASFHNEVYNEFKEIQKDNPKFMYSPERKGVTKFFVLQLSKLDLFYIDKVAVLQIPMKESGFNLATKSLITASHRHNIAVHYWTIDDKDDILKLIEIGADGIMTNIPSLLKEVYNEYKK